MTPPHVSISGCLSTCPAITAEVEMMATEFAQRRKETTCLHRTLPTAWQRSCAC